MNAEPAVNASDAAQTSGHLNFWPAIENVVPVVRWAILLTHNPILTVALVEDVLAAIQNIWDEWKDVYKARVAEVTGVSPDGLVFAEGESVRLKWEGDTPLIDLPRLFTREGAPVQFDVRSCLALCVKNFSSKVWTRFGLPLRVTDHFCPVAELQSRVAVFRQWARRLDEWFYGEFLRISETALRGVHSHRGAELEVTTVGLKIEDEQDDDTFDAWLLEGDERPNLQNEELRTFLAHAANSNLDPGNVGAESDSFWLVVPTTVTLPSGPLAHRKVVYLVRHFEGIAQVVGIGLDDSEAGDLAGYAALKVSRIVASRS